MEITPIRKRETELNPRPGSARLRANRFAPLQTVDRPKPGKLRDQDGWQAGCARKRVLPSRFLIGLSRASDETRRKGLLNPSDPQLLRGRVARRGRLARRPPRRRPSELAPLGPATGGASPPGEPSRIAPPTWAAFPGERPSRPLEDTTQGPKFTPATPLGVGERFRPVVGRLGGTGYQHVLLRLWGIFPFLPASQVFHYLPLPEVAWCDSRERLFTTPPKLQHEITRTTRIRK